MDNTKFGQVRLVREQYVAPPEYAAIAVVQPIDRGVVLIVAADGGELENCLVVQDRVFLKAIEDQEFGFARCGRPFALGWRQRQAKASGDPDALV